MKFLFPYGDWCIGGGFNYIKRSSERRGYRVQSNIIEMNEFGKFISEINLIDLPTLGNKFTWFNSEYNSVNRLDCFLTLEGLIENGV